MAAREVSFRTIVIRSLIWLGTGTSIGQLISWVSTLFVIRFLEPSDYGLMAMAASIIAFLAVISELGVSASLIQAEQIRDREIRQIFGFVIVSSLLGSGLCYSTAPLIANFYHEPKLTFLVRVLSLNFILIALYVIPQALFVREMNFGTKAKIDVSAQITSSVLMLILAVTGMGIWALVIGQITLHVIKLISFNVARHTWWKPVFSYKGAEKFLRYGLTLTGQGLLYYLYTISDTIIVGKFLGNAALGVYSVANGLASIPMEKVMPVITQISFASYSRIQDDVDRIRINILRTTRVVAYTGFPLFFGMATVASEAIPLALGQKWSHIVVPFQLICLILPLKAISPILPPAVFAIGKPKVNLINMAITFLVMSLSFLSGVKGGLLGICTAWIAVYPVIFLVTSKRSLTALGIPLKQFLSEITFPFLASAAMLLILTGTRKIMGSFHPLPVLVTLAAIGSVFYAGLVVFFKRNEFMNLKGFLQK